jgi:Sec-independent protein translocase protein TatA/GNAT superfamily N-acetyltransferase
VFGISLEELLVLVVLAFILFGPEKLPEYAAKMGRLVAKLRQASSDLSQQYQNPFNYPQEPAPEAGRDRPRRPAARFGAAGAVACPYCHQMGQPEFTFCPKCGHRLPEAPDAGAPAPAEATATPPPEPAATPYPVVQPLAETDIEAAVALINRAAQAYKGVIPADCWQEPYMPEEEFRAEISAGVSFWVYRQDGRVVAVTGRQDMADVTLIRHAYVDPDFQRQGVGSRLLSYLLEEIPGPTLVGTWAAAWWAIRFYEKHRFRLLPQMEKDRLLRTYWTISDRQVETSVVLADAKWLALSSPPE